MVIVPGFTVVIMSSFFFTQTRILILFFDFFPGYGLPSRAWYHPQGSQDEEHILGEREGCHHRLWPVQRHQVVLWQYVSWYKNLFPADFVLMYFLYLLYINILNVYFVCFSISFVQFTIKLMNCAHAHEDICMPNSNENRKNKTTALSDVLELSMLCALFNI